MSKIFPSEWIFPKTQKDIHMMSLKTLEKKFEVDVHTGLSSARAKELLDKHGKNQIDASYSSVLQAVGLSLIDFFSIILWICMFLLILMYQPLGGQTAELANLIAAALVALCLLTKSILVGVQKYKSIESMRSMQSMNASPVSVLRDSKWQKIPACDLVIGDVVEIRPNENVPADLRLISVNNLRLDKSILTGESEPIEGLLNHLENIETKINYFEAKNMVFTNFSVVSGYGKGIVVSVGNQSYIINDMAKHKKTSNRVNKQLHRLEIAVVVTSITMAVLYIIIWAVRIRVIVELQWTSVLSNMLEVAISGVPIGFPLALTAGLYIVQERLRKSDVILKDLSSILSVGGIDVILTDKTGTLTRNSLEVASVFYSTREVDVESCFQSPDVYSGGETALEQLLELCDFCIRDSSAHLIEQAMLEFAQKNRPGARILAEQYDTIDEIEFNSNIKYQVKLVKPREDKNTFAHYENLFGNKNGKLLRPQTAYMLMVRGAPDFLLPKCKFVLNENGGEEALNEASLRRIQSKINQWSLMGRRLIYFCKKTLTEEKFERTGIKYGHDFEKWFDLECNDLVFVGMIGFIDPPKPDINQSIEKLRGMGLRVVMVTGDYSITAASIAAQIGILSDMKYDTYSKFRDKDAAMQSQPTMRERSILLNGPEIDRLTPEEWKFVCTQYSEIVLSRATPNHKLQCVKNFQSNGYSVLMVGDGVNDVPALKQADLSVAMAKGSKIATEISDVVLLNSSFSGVYSLVSASRQILASISKTVLKFTILSVYCQYVPSLLTTVLGIPELYSISQKIFISSFVDVITSVSFFVEKAEPNEPRQWKKGLADSRLILIGLLFLGPLTLTFTYLNYFLYLKFFADLNPSDLISRFYLNDPSAAIATVQSVSLFSITIIHSLGNLYSIRTTNLTFVESLPIWGPYRNWYLLAASVFVIGLVVILIAFPIPGATANIPAVFYAMPLAFSTLIVLVSELRKICSMSRSNRDEK